MSRARILFYGDPHGAWEPLLRTFRDTKPSMVVILGDCDLEMTLHAQIEEIWNSEAAIAWIPGNHDTDHELLYDRLYYDEGQCIHGLRVQHRGVSLAGLGGIYKGRVWFPREGSEEPRFRTRQDYLSQVRPGERWRGGLPLCQRVTIFPEDHAKLRAAGQTDILVCHEAPTSHEHGFGAIDDLARDLRARLVIHGHHHRSYEGTTRDGIAVRGLAIAEPWIWEAGDE